MDDDEKKTDLNNNDFLLYYTKYRPYDINNNYNNNDNNNESIELNEDENDNNNILNGRWSQKEHLLFIKGCLLYGNNWKKVKKYIQTRSCSQIRSHAQKYLKKINKKYHGNKNNLNNYGDFNLKLSDDEIKKLVNKNKFSEKDMDDAELYIFSIFKSNKDKEKSLLDDNDEKESDTIKNNSSNTRSYSKTNKSNDNDSEKIFEIIKVTKEEKEREREKKFLCEENRKNLEGLTRENDNGEVTENNEIDNMYIEDNNGILENNGNNGNVNGLRNSNHKNNKNGKSKSRKILKENILAEKIDTNFTENEIFINKCLDSKDPKDLVKLLTHFGNDISFKVTNIKILKKYQNYLGLETDNTEENTNNNINKNNNVNNKETNEIYPISDGINNNYNFDLNQSLSQNIYPYMYNSTSHSYQFNPLCSPQLLVNSAFMNQY